MFRDSYVLCIYVMNILCTFHIFVYGYATYIWVEWERELKTAEMNTYKGDGVVLLWNFSEFLLHSARVEIFPDLHNFPDAQANPLGQTSCLHVARGHPHNLHDTSAGKQCVSHFLSCHPCNLCGMSKGSSNQYPTSWENFNQNLNSPILFWDW